MMLPIVSFFYWSLSLELEREREFDTSNPHWKPFAWKILSYAAASALDNYGALSTMLLQTGDSVLHHRSDRTVCIMVRTQVV
jgi:hypothetical protein